LVKIFIEGNFVTYLYFGFVVPGQRCKRQNIFFLNNRQSIHSTKRLYASACFQSLSDCCRFWVYLCCRLLFCRFHLFRADVPLSDKTKIFVVEYLAVFVFFKIKIQFLYSIYKRGDEIVALDFISPSGFVANNFDWISMAPGPAHLFAGKLNLTDCQYN